MNQTEFSHLATEHLATPTSNNKKRECLQCCANISPQRDDVIRHYEREHPEMLAAPKVQNVNRAKPISTKGDYIDNIVELMATNNLPFSFWSDPAVQRNQGPLMKQFGMTCSAKPMHKLLIKNSAKVKKRVADELKDRLIGIKLDIVTRKEGRILGISAQFIKDWSVQIRYLSMSKINGPADSKSLDRMVQKTMRKYKLHWRNVNTVTTDCGANVLLASKHVLGDVDKLDEDAIYISDEDEEEEKDEKEELQLIEQSPDLSVTENEEEQEIDPMEFVMAELGRKYSTQETSCAAHVIQLAYSDFMGQGSRKEDMAMLKITVRKVRDYVRCLPPGTDKPRLPTLANVARWGSTYEMVRSIELLTFQQIFSLKRDLILIYSQRILLLSLFTDFESDLDQIVPGGFADRWDQLGSACPAEDSAGPPLHIHRGTTKAAVCGRGFFQELLLHFAEIKLRTTAPSRVFGRCPRVGEGSSSTV